MTSIAAKFLQSSYEIKKALSEDADFLAVFDKTAEGLKKVVDQGGVIYLCGNGGSACDAMHFREELVARYKRERPGIRAQHFIDGSTITCWSNDYDYNGVFEREAKTFITDKDCLVGISTSGNSQNVISAINVAKEKGALTIGLLGRDGGALKSEVDAALVVPSEETDRIQEVHITLIHALCEYLEA